MPIDTYQQSSKRRRALLSLLSVIVFAGLSLFGPTDLTHGSRKLTVTNKSIDSVLPGTGPTAKATPFPAANIESKCGGTVAALAGDSPLGAAALDVIDRYPNFNEAQKAKDPKYFDAHPAGMMATNHGELKGFGVTMVQGNWPKAVANASGRLGDPTLLFFHKDGNHQDDWEIIGMGYTFKLNQYNEGPPTTIKAFDANEWWIHEAGYHHSPGDGGFSCAVDSNLKKSVRDSGKTIDAAGCNGVDDDDLETREFSADKKHGRYWAVHVWFAPTSKRPVVAKTDPWCRQSSKALVVASCAFFRQGKCPN